MFTLTPEQEKKETERTTEAIGVSKKEAAKMLGLSESTVHNLTQAGKLPCKRIGRRVIYPVRLLHEFLENQEQS